MSQTKQQMHHLLIEQSIEIELQKKRLLLMNKLLKKLPLTRDLFNIHYEIKDTLTGKEKVELLLAKINLEKNKEYVCRKFSEKFFEEHSLEKRKLNVTEQDTLFFMMNAAEKNKQQDKVDNLKKALLENVRKRKKLINKKTINNTAENIDTEEFSED
jgi:hypothetical protein